MQRLEPSPTSKRHFLLPLPPNTDPGSPELFSFYTYEIRGGARPRAGEQSALVDRAGAVRRAAGARGRATPRTRLDCSVIAEPTGVIRAAPYATPYVGLRRVLPQPPNTEIWIVLYARR